jgi:uncharacterized membrane protein
MLSFDIVVGALIVFPLLAEAAWLVLPIRNVEPTDLVIPVFVMVVVIALALAFLRGRLQGLLPATARLRAGFASAKPATVTRWAILAAVPIAAIVSWPYLMPVAPHSRNLVLTLRDIPSGPAPIFLAALAAAAAIACGQSWRGSFFLRQGARLAARWLAAVRRSPHAALWLTTACVGALYTVTSVMRHAAFQTNGFDVGIFTNAIWNLTHGYGYVSSIKGGINLFQDHQSPLFWLLYPLFWVIPQPETLFVAQAFGLAAGGPALFHLAQKRFGASHWAPAALPWLYWSYLPLRNANAFEFHPEVFMLPLFLWAFVGFYSNRKCARALGLVALLAALAAKESAPVVAAGIGASCALLSTRGSRQMFFGLALAALGVTVFLFDVKVVPHLFGGDYAYLDLYGRFGAGIGSLLLAPFTQPAYFFSQLINTQRVLFVFWTLAPLAFLPVCSWRGAIAVAPTYLMFLLSEGDQRVQTIYHYGIEPASALFWALPFGLASFASRFGWQRTGIWMLFCATAFFGTDEIRRIQGFTRTEHERWLASEFVPCLDARASMAASSALIPHVSTRRWISYPDRLRMPDDQDVACIAVDLNLDNWPIGKRGTVELMQGDYPRRGYRQTWSCGRVYVFQKEGSPCMRCTPSCPPPSNL